MKPIYFTVGPSATHKNFEKHMKLSLRLGIPSLSHRSDAFHKLYEKVDTDLKKLWNIPRDYKILFFSSATEIWDRLAQNCIDDNSLHFVCGSFGKKHATTVEAYGKQARCVNEKFISEEIVRKVFAGKKNKYEYISFVHNESSNGVVTPISSIHLAKRLSPKSLVIVDAVSSAPLPKFDFKKVDGVYFSVQKCLGLPAGLAVLIASPALIEKSIKIKKEKSITGYYRSFDTMMKSYEIWETYETPNVLNIFLLSKVLEDMLSVGISTLRKETKEKSKMIYDFFDKHPSLTPVISDKKYRSETVITIKVERDKNIKVNNEKNSSVTLSPPGVVYGRSLPKYDDSQIRKLKAKLRKEGFVVGSGYGEHKDEQIRIACFPAQLPHITKLLSSHAWGV